MAKKQTAQLGKTHNPILDILLQGNTPENKPRTEKSLKELTEERANMLEEQYIWGRRPASFYGWEAVMPPEENETYK